MKFIYYVLNSIKDKVVFDQETGLHYGFGADEFIKRSKSEQTSESQEISSELIEQMDNIIKDLNYYKLDDVIQLHRYVLAKAIKGEFKDKAKTIILDAILGEYIQYKKKGNGTLYYSQRVLGMTKQQIDISLNAATSKEELLDRLQNFTLNEKVSEEVQAYLASDQIQNDLDKHKQNNIKTIHKSNPNDVTTEDELYALKDDPFYGKIEIDATSLSQDNITRDEEDYVIQNEIKQKHFEKKKELLRIKGDGNYKLDRGNLKFKDVSQKKLNNPATGQEYFEPLLKDIFKISKLEKKINQIEQRLQLTRKQRPTFAEIISRAEELVEQFPLELKSFFDKEDGEIEFKYLNKNYDHGDLLWSQIGEEYEEVTPYNFADTMRIATPESYAEPPTPPNKMFIDDLGDDIFDSLSKQTEQKKSFSNTPHEMLMLEYANKVANTSYGNKEVSKFSNQQILELAIYKNMDSNPFFKHAITDNLKAISDAALDIVKPNQIYKDNPSSYHRYVEWARDNLITETERQKYTENFEEMSNQEGSVVAKAKRKRSTAFCVLTEGSGKITVNDQRFVEYFTMHGLRKKICGPLAVTDYLCYFDVKFTVSGSGYNSQSEACSLALAKALAKFDPSTVEQLENNPIRIFLKHNPKIVQPKTTGLYKARKKYPYKRR